MGPSLARRARLPGTAVRSAAVSAATSPETSLVPPDDAVAPVRHPEAPAPGTPLGAHYDHCFGCGQALPHGLHLQAHAGEGVSVTAAPYASPGARSFGPFPTLPTRRANPPGAMAAGKDGARAEASLGTEARRLRCSGSTWRF